MNKILITFALLLVTSLLTLSYSQERNDFSREEVAESIVKGKWLNKSGGYKRTADSEETIERY
ncbi:MAG: hypothetical protein ACOC8S_02875, partial [Bacteroidota bacterium]